MVYSGFWRRFAAAFIDTLIILIPTLLLRWMLPYVGELVAWFLYYPFFEASETMGTPGKLFMGMQVTTEAGARLTFTQALSRRLLALVSATVMCLGYLFNLFTPKRQCFHDLMVGCVVVDRPVSTNVDWVAVWLREFRKVFNLDSSSSQAARREAVEPVMNADAETMSSPIDANREVAIPPGNADASSTMQLIEQLHGLLQQGAISEAEYLAKKQELLQRI